MRQVNANQDERDRISTYQDEHNRTSTNQAERDRISTYQDEHDRTSTNQDGRGRISPGGTLIFSAYVGSDPASTVHPKKISGISSTPKKYLKF